MLRPSAFVLHLEGLGTWKAFPGLPLFLSHKFTVMFRYGTLRRNMALSPITLPLDLVLPALVLEVTKLFS